MSCALAGLTTGEGASGTGAFFATGVAFFGGGGRAETRGSPAGGAGGAATGGRGGTGAEPPSSAARSRRATGASTVLDADLTNSPISLSLASTVLLSTPSSFASSCTRAFPGTALLTSRWCEPNPQRPHSCTRSLVISGTSSCAHVGRPTLLSRTGRRRPVVRRSGRLGSRPDVLGQHTGVEDTGDSQRPPEGVT